ncbi:TIR domain-containing protein [Methanomassiliicoccus luminyensis]|uniref:TIR domain-containing protein n=1 Tax=Methanomassiliicoccus luminyensis TaxID=1080712 RepID=UPI00036E7DE7|nr:TIR domain-containing protein [Methanomassiliicoccus luminyensis]
MTPQSGAFRQLLSSSIRYGLTNGSEKAEKVSLTELGASIVAPTKEGEVKSCQYKALTTPVIFNKILTFYDSKKIPSENILKNTLRREFGIIPEDVDACYKVLMTNIKYLGLIESIKGSDYLQLKKIKEVVDDEVESPSSEGDLEDCGESNRIEVTDESECKVNPITTKPKQIFVAHGKNKKPLEQLKSILSQFKVPYKVAVDEPHNGRPISDKVAQLMKECSSGIFIFTADEETTGSQNIKVLRPSDNVVFELGAGIVLYSDKIVILREEGVSFGSDFTGYGYITFEKDKLDAKAFELMKELISLGFLQVTPT